MAKPLAGMYAALLTGFADDGGFCPERQAAIMSHVGRQGLDGLYIGGSSAESGLMSTEELLDQQRVIAGLRAPNHGRIIAHVGQPSTAASVALARQAAALGFDGVSALPPHAYPFSDEEILAYYAEVAAASDLPMIVYEIPLRTGRALPLPLLDRIVALPNVVGIKFTSTDLFKLAQLRRAHPDLTVFFGFDEMYHAAGAQGCDGGIGTTYNVLGKLYAALNRAIAADDLAQARRLQGLSQDYVAILMDTGVIPGVKLSLRLLGCDAGPARPPMQLRDAAAQDRLRAFLESPTVRPWLP